jgi:hypothetical protein
MDEERKFSASDDRVIGESARKGPEKSSNDWEAAPLSTALGIPTLIGDKPPADGKDQDETNRPAASLSDHSAPFSEALGMPALVPSPESMNEAERAAPRQGSPRIDPAAPLSSALGIPTLIGGSKRAPVEGGAIDRLSREPAPVSKELGISALIGETTRSDDAAEKEDLESRKVPAAQRDPVP